MATLKGAYQKFVTSIIRFWRREENKDTEDEGTKEREVEESCSSTYFLAEDELTSDITSDCDPGGVQADYETSQSAPDLLEATSREETSQKSKKKNKKHRNSILKNTKNSSTPNLLDFDSQTSELETEFPPVFARKQSETNLRRPITVLLEHPSNEKLDQPSPNDISHAPLTLFRLQPPTPPASREPSPTLSRRSNSPNFLHDHPPVVLRRQLGQHRYPASVQLRRENSSDDILSGPSNKSKRKARPKSVSDIFLSDYQSSSKLKKSTSFLKLSPSVFRKQPLQKSTDSEGHKDSEKQPESRPRTLTLASRITKFASKRIDGTLKKRSKSDPKSRRIVIMKKIEISTEKSMPVEPFLNRLRDYNTCYEEKPSHQFKWKQDKDGNHVVDGMLNIYWGLKKAIRLQMQDSGVKIRPQSDLAAAKADAVRKFEERTTGIPVGEESVDLVLKNETLSGTLLRRRISDAIENINGGGDSSVIDVENGILGETRQRTYDRRRMALRLKAGGEKVHVSTPDADGMIRQKSVILRKRLTNRSGRKRFSINGHAYNHRTSVFTPAYASVTNVRVTSKSTCDDVIKHLLNKFRVENSFEEFSLYVVKETGERRELSRNEYPLVTRVLSGPNEQVCKIFVMDRNMHKDITYDVAQYFKLDMNILEMFVKKFTEEEEREAEKLKERYQMYRKMLEQRIQEASAS